MSVLHTFFLPTKSHGLINNQDKLVTMQLNMKSLHYYIIFWLEIVSSTISPQRLHLILWEWYNGYIICPTINVHDLSISFFFFFAYPLKGPHSYYLYMYISCILILHDIFEYLKIVKFLSLISLLSNLKSRQYTILSTCIYILHRFSFFFKVYFLETVAYAWCSFSIFRK